MIDPNEAIPRLPRGARRGDVGASEWKFLSACRCSARQWGAIYLPIVAEQARVRSALARQWVDGLIAKGLIHPLLPVHDELPASGEVEFQTEPEPSEAEKRAIEERIAIASALKLAWAPDEVPLAVMDRLLAPVESARTRERRAKAKQRRST